MTPRAIGCMVVAAVLFVAIGIVGLNLASSRIACPDRIQWDSLSYLPVGSPAASPMVDGAAVKLGSTFIGLATRDVYGPVGSSGQPAVIAMDCGDGTYLTYRRTSSPQSSPLPSAGG